MTGRYIHRIASLAVVMPMLVQLSFAEPDGRPDSFVKVLVRSQVGLFDESSMLEILQVQQLIPFPGLVMDEQGHVVSFVGVRWPELAVPDARITVETANGERYPAQVVGIDQRISLAVLSADVRPSSVIRFAAFPQNGQVRFFNLGPQEWRTSAPFLLKVGKKPGLPEHDVQVGGLGKSSQGWESSVVVDREDKVVGIVTGTRRYPYSRTVETCQILPADVIRKSTGRILATRSDIEAGWLGAYLGDGKDGRTIITRTVRGGPAERAGLQPGDAILKVDDQPVEQWQRFVERIRWAGAGHSLPLTFKRNEEVKTISVRLSRRMDVLPRIQWMVRSESWPGRGARRVPRIAPGLPPLALLGFDLDPLPAQLADFFKCPDGQGLLVREVTADGLADKAGLRAGDVLIRVNDVGVSSPADLQPFLRNGSAFDIQFIRGGQIRKVKLRLP
ncbi:MAG: PDZ domain-containing protein [Acidobacteriota bacterium]